jgi:hypothetical protein
MKRLLVLFAFGVFALGAAVLPGLQNAQAQAACFGETGFCIGNSSFNGYYNARGGMNTFGPPISREFTFLGFRVQFFQGHIMQLMPNGSVATMNLLDEGLMPVSHVNTSTFPAPDRTIVGNTPTVNEPNYAERIVEYIRRNAPNEFDGRPVRFFDRFMTTVDLASAFPAGGGSPSLLPLLNLEIWGSVTSAPMVEPRNASFIYQRFQRSIMHYRDACRCTERILLADWFKTVFTGQGLPGDLAEEMVRSPFYLQWSPGSARWLARPDELPSTDLTNAFVPDLPGYPTPPAASGPAQPPSLVPQPAPAPIGAVVKPSIKLTLSEDRVNKGEEFTIRLEAEAEGGVAALWWWATDTDDEELRDTHTFDCNGATPCRQSWKAHTDDEGRLEIHAMSRDNAGRESEEVTLELRVRASTS